MTYVKICGITNQEDALVAIEAGADYLGFIFHADSPRCVTAEQAAAVVAELPPGVATVGVFVNYSAAEIFEVRRRVRLTFAQLNGDELPETVRSIPGAYKAIRPMSVERVQSAIKGYGLPDGMTARLDSPDLLIDAYHPDLMGGTGQQVSREIALEARKHTRRLMLAGGLTPDNVAEVVRMVRPWAVDVASGVEARPGKKDHGKVKAFIEAVRTVDEERKA